jgi:hypothetical protein
METVRIRKPIWKTRSVGIDERRISDEGVFVEILYEKKNGEREYPYLYFCSKRLAMKGYRQKVDCGVWVRVVKIADLEVV